MAVNAAAPREMGSACRRISPSSNFENPLLSFKLKTHKNAFSDGLHPRPPAGGTDSAALSP